MAKEQSILCPLCGNKVPPGLTRCPVCATELQRTITRRTEEQPPVSDFLRKDIPSQKLPQAKSNCPQCGLGLQGGETKCPRCGIPLSAEEALLECPDCGALSPTDAKSCVRCGCDLREQRAPKRASPPRPAPAPSPAPPPVIPAPVPVSKPARAQKPPAPPPEIRPQVTPETPVVSEKVTPAPTPVARQEPQKPREEPARAPARTGSPGLVNGKGAVNGTGFVNGRGAAGGAGLVNGRGAINGTGMTNGTRGEAQSPRTASRSRSVVSKWQFIALLVAVIVVVPVFMYLTYSGTSAPITIDGDFGDWTDVMKFGMRQNSETDRMNVTEWGVKTAESTLFVYAETRGSIMGTNAVDSFFVFVDSDARESTGYLVSGIGADYMLEFDGWNGSIGSSSMAHFPSTSANRNDWSGWDATGTPSARLGTNQIEGAAVVPSISGDSRYVLISQTGQTDRGISHAVREGTALLIVEAEPLDGFVSGVVAPLVPISAMRLTLTCQGGAGSVTAITPTVSGATIVPLQTGTISLTVGASQTVDVLVDTSAQAAGTVASVSIQASEISSSFSSVEVVGGPAQAYVSAAPSSIRIDGAFGDWIGRTTVDSDTVQMNDENIDIASVGAVNTTASASFYASVVGEMCGGSFVPSQITKPSGAGGGSVITPSKTGEDMLNVYLDTDMSALTGSLVIHPSKSIGADYRIEIRGLNGHITSKALFEFVSGGWNFVSDAIQAANDQQQVELGVAASAIASLPSLDFIIEMTDWRGWSDMATAVPAGTRAADMPGTRAWMVDNTIASADATATSTQRKLFHDGTNFWSVYVDGGNAVAQYSTDGMTWTSDGRIFKTNNVGKPSIWYDAVNYTVYVVGDRSTASVNAYLQRGTVSPATHTIAWAVADRVLAVSVSTNTVSNKNTFISRDASGYVWIMAVNCTTTAPTRYDLSVFRTTVVNSIAGVWTHVGNMGISLNQQPIKGCILPAGTGSNMWAVYTYSGNVASRKYTGSWGAETMLYTAAGAGGNTEDAPPSALVDARGVIHVVYGDDHEQPVGTSKPHIYYTYNAGAGWTAPRALSSTAVNDGFKYPTISLDEATGHVVAFWCDMQTQYIVAKMNVSGVWSSLTLNAQTANPKIYLTSIYSAPIESIICYLWTQNTTAQIHVIFDRIPEFGDVALPALGLAAFVVLIAGPVHRRQAKK